MKRVLKNIIKPFLTASLLAMAALSLLGLVACDIDDVESISVTPNEITVRIGEFDYDDYDVTLTYGSGKTEQLKLTESMISASDRVNLFIEGDHEITVSYENKTATMKISVLRNVFAGATFDDLDVVYTGEFYTAEVKNVPEGTTVTYPTTNRFRNAGEYEATAILRKDAYEMKEMKAKIVIRKADYDLSGTTFADKQVTYDGDIHSLSMEGEMPSGLYVDYTITREGGREEKGNSARNAGVYTVHATFTGDANNFNKVEPMDAVLTIGQAEIDLSGVKFEDKTEVYDRTRHSVTIDGALPMGVAVAYENNEHVDAGEYKATAKFTVADSVNYAPVPDMSATLTVLKAEYDMSDVHYNGSNFTYDGTEKKIEVQGSIPNGVKVTYANNTGVDAGTYQATATFAGSDKNYNDPSPMTATLVIDPAEAQMDSVVFLRMRFISMSRELIDFDYSDPDDWDDYDEYEKLKNYDPYSAAMAYRPDNVPQGLAVKEIKYCKTDGWVEDLTVYGENDGFEYVDAITEDGYYVVVVTFEENGNYLSVSPVKTQIRTSTVADFHDNAVYLYSGNESGTGGTYYDYSFWNCTDHYSEADFGNATASYCDCSIFNEYRVGGAEEIVSDYDAEIEEAKLEDYSDLAKTYRELVLSQDYYLAAMDGSEMFLSFYKQPYEQKIVGTFEKAKTASKGVDDFQEPFEFDSERSVVLTIGDGEVTNFLNITGIDSAKDKADYAKIVAMILGYADADAMYADVKTVAQLLFGNRAGASENSIAAQCRYKGAIYTNQVFVLPYKFSWLDPESEIGEMKQLFAFVIVDNLHENAAVRVIVNDLDVAKDLIGLETCEKKVNVNVYGRCTNVEKQIWKWSRAKVVVTENGEEVEKTITSVSDNPLIVGYVDGVEENRYIYKFVNELPGNCSQEADGYNEEDYTIENDFSVVTFCDCDPLGTVIKNAGDASNIAKRIARDEHAQLSDSTADLFDTLSLNFDAFISNYNIADGSANEWKIGVNNRHYGLIKEISDSADVLFYIANRNIRAKNVHTVQDTAIIGMNRNYAISLNGSGVSYSVDGYRAIVMKLFGFDDSETFTNYSDVLARALQLNEKRSSTEFGSTRVLYDGAIYTSNGYFVLPFVIKSSLTEKPVLAFAFVDTAGNMSVWLNDARNAFNAVNFSADAEEKARIEIGGRCTYFEEDDYTMIEEFNEDVIEIVERLKGYNPFERDYTEVATPVALKRIKSISDIGEYMVMTTYVDEEGFSVCFNSVYDYDNDVDPQDGFYSYITIVDLNDLKAMNERAQAESEETESGETEGDETEGDEW